MAVFPTAISSQNWPDINLSLEMEGQSQVMYNQVESINNEGDCFCVTTNYLVVVYELNSNKGDCFCVTTNSLWYMN